MKTHFTAILSIAALTATDPQFLPRDLVVHPTWEAHYFLGTGAFSAIGSTFRDPIHNEVQCPIDFRSELLAPSLSSLLDVPLGLTQFPQSLGIEPDDHAPPRCFSRSLSNIRCASSHLSPCTAPLSSWRSRSFNSASCSSVSSKSNSSSSHLWRASSNSFLT